MTLGETSPAPATATPRMVPFASTLRQRQRDAGAKRKGERTRDRLKLGALQELDDRGYLRLRVTDICKRAKVSPAVFYLYFKNKKEITIEVLTEFIESLFDISRTNETQRTLYEAIYESNLTWVSSVRTNAGLMRCLLQLSDHEPEFKELSERLNYEWFLHVTGSLLRRFGKTRPDERSVLLAVYALGGMMDELSRKLLVAREVHLESLVRDIAPTDEALAEFLSVMWYRALFGQEPAAVRHPASRELLRFGGIDPAKADASPAASAGLAAPQDHGDARSDAPGEARSSMRGSRSTRTRTR